MNGNVANSKALGFGVLAIGVWMFSVVNAGIGGSAGINGALWHLVGLLAMLGLLIAGLSACLRRDTWFGFFFLLWAGVFWGVSGSAHALRGIAVGQQDVRFAGWLLVTLAVVNFYLWITTFKSHKLGWAVSLTVLLLWLSLLALGLHGFFHVWLLFRIGGALGLASAIVAFYVSAGAIAVEYCPNLKLPGTPSGAESMESK